MRKTLRALLSLGVVALAAPAVLNAQDPETDPIPAAEAAPQPIAAEAVLEAVEGARAATLALGTRTELIAEGVEVVIVDELFPGEHAAMLDEALAKDPEALTELQAAVAANEAINSALVEQAISPDNVVALSLPESGGAVVYVRQPIDDPIDDGSIDDGTTDDGTTDG